MISTRSQILFDSSYFTSSTLISHQAAWSPFLFTLPTFLFFPYHLGRRCIPVRCVIKFVNSNYNCKWRNCMCLTRWGTSWRNLLDVYHIIIAECFGCAVVVRLCILLLYSLWYYICFGRRLRIITNVHFQIDFKVLKLPWCFLSEL